MFRPVTLPPDVSGQLYLYSMPGRYEHWAEFETEANRTGIEIIVCLAPDDEIKKNRHYTRMLSTMDHSIGRGKSFQFRITAFLKVGKLSTHFLNELPSGYARAKRFWCTAALVLDALGLLLFACCWP